MNDVIKKISLSDDLSEEDGPGGSDVIVQFGNNDLYVATFYSIGNLEHMIALHNASEERDSETYYKIFNAVIVNDLRETDLMPVIEAMVVEGDFQLVFKKV
ncbi:hypothetical protein [Chryseolinea soli]|uniref:Uncharacterized protein n=1 Tax=Chryseolinea soli TaxID=2321403 RepID=A0A385SVI6_9BACT|nr:hypothetical protein [Chryseolinea soli]AYB33985.1 hypothetical protein D4L85_26910 [Chryseolinea soli]